MANSNKENDERSIDPYDYLRVGTTIYVPSVKPMLSKRNEKILLPWNLDTIKQDHPNNWKDIIRDLKRYKGFCTIPEHLNYARDYMGFYNVYEPLSFQPKEGNCDTILAFIKHIFEEHYELGLDYLQLLYTKPLQRLPVLCLVSKKRETGKTTFLDLLKVIYGNNMTFNNNDDFRSIFNSDWVTKLIVGIDEVLLDKKEDSERIKNLSTAKTYKAEAKGKDRFEVDYFGKIILCSNNETNFMVIGIEETRYWVRNIKTLDSMDKKYLERLTLEIPQFLHFLLHRKLFSTNETRMWFTKEQINTEALMRIKSEFVNKVEKELFEIIKEIMEIKELESMSFINLNIKILLERAGHRVSKSRIRNILEEQWRLTQYPNASNFTTYQFDHSGMLYEMEAKGRYYTINQDDLKRINVAMFT